MILILSFLAGLVSIWVLPIVTAVLITMCASTGYSLGIRAKYVQFLLAVFEWARKRIERSKNVHAAKLGQEEEPDAGRLSPGSTRSLLARQIEAFAYYDDATVNSSGKASPKNDFRLADSYEYVKWGMEAIIEDQVTKSFEAEEIASWNMLTRTNMNYQYISLRLSIVWGLGFLFRYLILAPIRILIMIIGMIWLGVCNFLIGFLPAGKRRRLINQRAYVMCCRILARGFSAIVRFHDGHNKAQSAGICVANHTTPMDVIVLSVDNCYSLIGQRHKGIMGYLQQCVSRASDHIWFERAESKDRLAVSKRLREHVAEPSSSPILIFPEGTCINNTSVMMFKKGCFEVDCTIYPVAVKYDPRFGDAFWNSSEQSMGRYLLMMMTSWAIVCDVWYLPPMHRRQGEDAGVFAARVKNEIAKKGGLVELDWDGQLKRQGIKQEWKEMQQKVFSQRLSY